MGNYFEEMEQRPPRSVSLVRRALSRRRYSDYGPAAATRPGFLTRTLSLSRSGRKEPGPSFDARAGPLESDYPTIENPPADRTKLHPFWRPAYSDCMGDEDDCVHDIEGPEDVVYRYPAIDNRPRRGFSARMKRTFAVLPIRDDAEFYSADDREGPDRRTIRRTPSGNLRVTKHRRSLESLRHADSCDDRPYTAPERRERLFGHGHSRGSSRVRGDNTGRKARFATLSSTLEGLQRLPRRLSERRREKRTQELRQKISRPREVRDGVGEVIRRRSHIGVVRNT
jgi:hypothetical protein